MGSHLVHGHDDPATTRRFGPRWLSDHLFVNVPEVPDRALIECYLYWLVLCFGTGVLLDLGQWAGLWSAIVEQVVLPVEAGIGALILWRFVPDATGSHLRYRVGIVLTSLGLAGVGIWDLPVAFVWIVVLNIGLWLVLRSVPSAPRPRWRFWERRR